jgi:transposase
MLNLAAATRVFLALAPADLRGSFNRLSALAQTQLAQDPLSGHLFVFTNRRRNRLKILFWDGSGLWVCAKTHDPHCPNWFIETSLPLPSAIRNTGRNVRGGWR